MEVNKEEPLEFQWGKAGARGKNPSVQFYKSFRFDGIDYALHDCVYLWTDGVPQPYIGKLVKIWEHKQKAKKVKVQWFFHPSEISYYLKDQNVLENEVFLASGKDVGVANVNPLEAIAGKCNVVCISKDSRNPQPTNEELSEADYVFYRIFDVDNFSISDKWGDRVGELEVKFIFNRVNERSNNPGLFHGVKDDRNVVGVKVKPRDSDSTMGLSESVDIDSKVESQMKGSEDLEVRPAKRMKLGDDDSKDINPISLELKANICSSKESTLLAKDLQLDSESNHMDAVLSKKRKVDQDFEVGKTKFAKKFDGDSRSYAPSKSSISLESPEIERPKKLIVTRRPNVETNSWFRHLSWEERIPTAQEEGTLILLQNLDPEYTSGEVEDIIWHAFEQKCSAKMVQHTTISSPVCGQALVILRSKEVADRVLKKLSEGFLMLPNGRPLVGSLARLPKVSQNPANFVGHLSIDKIRHKIQKETEAVSTSHYSQPNTIEFEMAMDWFLLQARSTMWWKKLYKKQIDEIEKTKAKFKSKSRSIDRVRRP